MYGRHDIVGQAHERPGLDDVVVQIELPPLVLNRARRLVCMMIVMPAFARRNDGDEPVVHAVIVGVIVAIAKHVAQRVD